MNNKYLILSLSLLSCFVFSASKCRKDNENQFCSIQRKTYLELSEVDAQVIYSTKYKMYCLNIKQNLNQNIDSQITGFVCELDKKFRSVGTIVKVSGTLKYFNDTENMTPEIGGQSIYYLTIKQIAK